MGDSNASKSKVAGSYTEIYVWGNDEYGQLGLGHRYHKASQKQGLNHS